MFSSLIIVHVVFIEQEGEGRTADSGVLDSKLCAFAPCLRARQRHLSRNRIRLTRCLPIYWRRQQALPWAPRRYCDRQVKFELNSIASAKRKIRGIEWGLKMLTGRSLQDDWRQLRGQRWLRDSCREREQSAAAAVALRREVDCQASDDQQSIKNRIILIFNFSFRSWVIPWALYLLR